MYRKFRNVPSFRDFPPICPYFIGFRVGKHAGGEIGGDYDDNGGGSDGVDDYGAMMINGYDDYNEFDNDCNDGDDDEMDNDIKNAATDHDGKDYEDDNDDTNCDYDSDVDDDYYNDDCNYDDDDNRDGNGCW